MTEPTTTAAPAASVQSIVQTGTATVLQELEAAGEEALTVLAKIIDDVRTGLTGGETAEEVVTAMLNTAESSGLTILENFASATLEAIAALLLKALPTLI